MRMWSRLKLTGHSPQVRGVSQIARVLAESNGESPTHIPGKPPSSFPCPARWDDLTGHLKKPYRAPELLSIAACRASRPIPTRRHSDPLWRVAFPRVCKSCAAQWKALH